MFTSDMDDTKFRIGQKVRVVNYGHPIWQGSGFIDIRPHLVGCEAVISKARKSYNGEDLYCLEGIPEKVCHYENNQLELVTE